MTITVAGDRDLCASSGNRCAATEAPVHPIGRFAPTPSGRMHLGNVYAFLLAWLSIRSAQGTLLLRIEDLDERTRSGPWTDLLIDDLQWLGLYWDDAVVYQHDRVEAYQAAADSLEARGLTYPCFCTRAELHAATAPHASDGTPIYAGTCRHLSAAVVSERSRVRPPATRLRVPTASEENGLISFTDRVYGTQQQLLERDCGDFLIRRSDGVFAYQLAVVVDDASMGVTEVVRGSDLISSTPRQIYLQRLLGYAEPAYAHIPLLIAPDGRRLAKRDHDLDMETLRRQYDTPDALLGQIAYRAGIAPDATPHSAEQLVEYFSWERLRAHHDDIVVSQA